MHTTSKLSIIAAAATLLAALSAFGAASDPSGLTLVDLTSPDGTVTSSVAFESGGPLSNAFNDDETLATRILRNGKTADIVYEFEVATKVTAYGIYNFSTYSPEERAPKTWTFWGINDGDDDWTLLDDSQTSETGWAAMEYRFYYFGDKGSFKKYKIDITANNGNQYLQFARMEFYDVDVADAVPIFFAGGGMSSDVSSITVAQPFVLREGATVTGVKFLYGTSEDVLSESENAPAIADGVATISVAELSGLTKYYWKMSFTVSYSGMTKDWNTDVGEITTRGTDTLVPGSNTFLSDKSWNSGIIPNELVDLHIDGDGNTVSEVALTMPSGVTCSYGSLEIDADDSLAVTKNFGGNATASFAGLTNAGTINVNAHANGNQQNVTLYNNGAFENNGVVNVNGSTSRNRTTVTFRVDNDRYENNGTINVTQTASDRNCATLEIKQNGVFVNNGLIAVKLLSTYTGGSGASYARVNIGDTTEKGILVFSGSGILRMYECDRTNAMDHKPAFTGGAKSTVVTNGVNHTIQGAGNINNFSLSNDGLVLADGENLSLNIENTYTDLGGVAMYNNPSGRMVAKGAAGMYLGSNTTKNSEFHNLGLVEARAGSFIAFRTGVTEQYNKGTVPTTTAMLQGGRWAGGGEFRIPRPLTLLEGAVLAPGDLANTLAQDGETVIYGTGDSTCGTLAFTNSLTLSAGTVSEFQIQGRTRFDALHVGGTLTLGGTFKVVGKPHGGTYRIITADAPISGEFDEIDMSAADGAKAPKLKFGSATVEEEVPTGETDAGTGEPIMTTVSRTTYYVDAEIAAGFIVMVK